MSKSEKTVIRYSGSEQLKALFALSVLSYDPVWFVNPCDSEMKVVAANYPRGLFENKLQ